MIGNNEFFGGINTVTDVLKIKNSSIRDSFNMRSIDIDGHGLVKINLKGNTIHFTLTNGFTNIGKVETNYGFAVIFSYNSVTHEGEIGTFPSPNASGGGFNNIYKPLMNFNGGLPLRSTEFNFSLTKPIRDGYVRVDSDQSINIYFTDNSNPYRVVNTGFTVGGVYTSRGYTTAQLRKFINVFLNTPVHPAISLNTIGAVGKHKAGTYIYYIRYSTQTYDTTPFIVHSGPVQISPDVDFDTVKNIALGQVEGFVTNKSVTLTFAGMDTDFPLFQIARVYHYGDNLRDVKLYDKYYETGANITVLVTDDENKIELTLQELLYKHPYHQIGKTMKSFNKRAWYANLSDGDEINDEYLKGFAEKIVITYDVLDLPIDYYGASNSNPQVPLLGYGDVYKNFQLKYDFVGYFRGESYCFATEYVLTKSGATTEAYPLFGTDEWKENLPGLGYYDNLKGIYRFPCQYDEPLVGTLNNYGVKRDWLSGGGSGVKVPADNLRLIGVKFDLTAAKAWLASNQPAARYFEENIYSMYFNRAERKPNLLYEGLMVGAYSLDFPTTYDEAFMKIVQVDDNQFSATFPAANFSKTEFPNWIVGKAMLGGQNVGHITGDPTNPPFAGPIDSINPMQMPKRYQDISLGGAGNAMFYQGFQLKRINWRKFPLYARGNAFNDTANPMFPGIDKNYPWNYAAIPFTTEWIKPGVDADGTDPNDDSTGVDRVSHAYIEVFPGLHESYIKSPATYNHGYPQVMPWCFRALFSVDYLFKRYFNDGNNSIMLWSKAGFLDYPDLSSHNNIPYNVRTWEQDAPFELVDTLSLPDVRPYVTGSIMTEINNLRDPGTDFRYVQFGGEQYGINGWEVAEKKSFVGMFLDGTTDSPNGLFSLYAERATGSHFHKFYNRAMAFPSYIGLNLSEFNGRRGNDIDNPIDATTNYTGNDTDMLNYIAGIYSKNPIPSSEGGLTDIRDDYDPVKLNFYRISYPVIIKYKEDINSNIVVSFAYPEGTTFEWTSEFVSPTPDSFKFDFTDLTNDTVTCFRGDCYIGKWSMKTITNPDGYGVLPDLIGNVYNDNDLPYHSYQMDPDAPALSDPGVTNRDQALTYYDKIKAGFGHILCFYQQSDLNLAMRIQLKENKESFYNWLLKEDQLENDFQPHSIQNVYRECIEQNKGYNITLGSIPAFGYDPSLPYRNKKFAARVMFSDPQVDGEFQDGYRKIYLNSYQDFDLAFGGFNQLFIFGVDLMGVQDFAIVAFSTDERAQAITTAGQITIGTGAILAPKATPISSKIGSQHQFSMIETDAAIYGWDVEKRRAWRLTGNGLEMISISKQIHTSVEKYFLSVNNTTDNSYELDDNPYIGYGINCGLDRKNNEVIFHLSFPQKGSGRQPVVLQEEFVFNEVTDFFDLRTSVYAPMYITINSDFIALNPNNLSQFYLQNSNILRCNFFGVNQESSIKFVVNGDAQGLSDEKKLFQSMDLVSNGQALSKVIYRNLMQTATHSPFQGLSFAEAYAEPVYRENLWYLPIKRADAVPGTPNNIFQVDSVMRDKYIETELFWNTNNEAFIKSAITNFIISSR